MKMPGWIAFWRNATPPTVDLTAPPPLAAPHSNALEQVRAILAQDPRRDLNLNATYRPLGGRRDDDGR